MRPTHSQCQRLVASLCGLLFYSAVTVAGPVEDMEAGEAAFKQGDVVGAMSWFKKAAEQGYAPAQARLADILDYSEANEEALEWYRKAADQGSVDGAYGLARMYANGEGVERSNEEAVRWFNRAAEQGHQGAMWTLADAYESGGLGLKPDSALALKWLRTAAERPGGEWAITRLARAYRQGELGLAVDPDQATQLESPPRNTQSTPQPATDSY